MGSLACPPLLLLGVRHSSTPKTAWLSSPKAPPRPRGAPPAVPSPPQPGAPGPAESPPAADLSPLASLLLASHEYINFLLQGRCLTLGYNLLFVVVFPLSSPSPCFWFIFCSYFIFIQAAKSIHSQAHQGSSRCPHRRADPTLRCILSFSGRLPHRCALGCFLFVCF